MAVALINAAAHPAAIPYFTRYPQEPIPGKSFVTIDKMVDLVDSAVVKGKRVRSPMTNLTTLLKAIPVSYTHLTLPTIYSV